METVLLRKLTLKSKLGVGKYANETIIHLLERNKRKAVCYLRWIYFNCEKITFLDEILIDILKIEEIDLIPKPSKKPSQEKHEYLKEKYYYNTTDFNGWYGEKVMKKGSVYRKEKILNSKLYNRHFNQK